VRSLTVSRPGSPRLARPWLLGLAAALPLAASASASPDLLLDSGRYLARYPGLVIGATALRDPRDQAYDAQGQRLASVAPAYGPGSAFPLTRLSLDFDWTLPLFETEALPFVSSRLWAARAVLGYADVASRGPIAAAAHAAGDPSARAGIHDLDLAFGPVLVGSADWRTRTTAAPLSVLLLAEARLPIGAHDPAAPNNAGGSVYAYGARLGAHWQPQSGGLAGFRLDAGLRLRRYGSDQEPVFNAQAPAQPGRDLEFDATLARRVWRALHAQLSYYRRDGAANEYRGVRGSAQPPEAPPGQDSFPDPATQRDRGSREQRLQLGLGAFLGQHLWLGLAWTHPLSGRSAGFELPYLRQTRNCEALGGCMPQANGSDAVDGLGDGRAYASDSWQLRLRWQPRSSQGGP